MITKGIYITILNDKDELSNLQKSFFHPKISDHIVSSPMHFECVNIEHVLHAMLLK